MCQKLRKKVWRRWVRAEIFRTELSRAQKFLSWVELGTSIFELKRAWFYFMIQSSFSSKLFLDPKIRSFQEKKYYLLKENRVKLQVKLGIKKCWKVEGRCQKSADVIYGRPLSWLRFPTTLKAIDWTSKVLSTPSFLMYPLFLWIVSILP